jgi:molecular chaperone DnaK
MLDYVHDVAARSLGDEAADGFPAVIAVPAGSSSNQCATIERIAVTAGFDLVSSVEEPVAAMHAVERVVQEDDDTADEFRGAFAGETSGPIAVFDMGGFVSTVSVLERRGSTYSVLASSTTTDVSGSLVDSLLFRRVVDRFYQDVGIDLSIDPLASYRILEAVEAAKLELSSRRTTDLNLPFITADQTGAKHLVQKLSTFDLARVLEAPVAKATTLCDATLKTAGLRKEDIGLLVLIGGGVRSEFVQTELEKYFKLRAFTSKNFQPEEAVVVGATEFGRRLVLDEAN